MEIDRYRSSLSKRITQAKLEAPYHTELRGMRLRNAERVRRIVSGENFVLLSKEAEMPGIVRISHLRELDLALRMLKVKRKERVEWLKHEAAHRKVLREAEVPSGYVIQFVRQSPRVVNLATVLTWSMQPSWMDQERYGEVLRKCSAAPDDPSGPDRHAVPEPALKQTLEHAAFTVSGVLQGSYPTMIENWINIVLIPGLVRNFTLVQ